MRKYKRNKIVSENNPGKLIHVAVEWFEEENIKIPDWCPIKI